MDNGYPLVTIVTSFMGDTYTAEIIWREGEKAKPLLDAAGEPKEFETFKAANRYASQVAAGVRTDG